MTDKTKFKFHTFVSSSDETLFAFSIVQLVNNKLVQMIFSNFFVSIGSAFIILDI